MELIACQEELNIVIRLMEQQVNMVSTLQSALDTAGLQHDRDIPSPSSRRPTSIRYGHDDAHEVRNLVSRRSTFRQLSSSLLADPVAQLLDNLERELIDLRDLRDNTDRLVNRTIQLVNIRLEDHGKVCIPIAFSTNIHG